MVNFDVDLVIAYVDGSDTVWRKQYMQYCLSHPEYARRAMEISNSRYNTEDGLFKYMLAGVDKFMPWVRRIYLIVSNIEQVPKFINSSKTKVVLHKDIIPKAYLPTFNSTTIEMFLHNILGLSEHFIYANDDMFPTAPMSKEDFFTDDGKIKINFLAGDLRSCGTQFRRVCSNCFKHVATSLGHKVIDENKYLRPIHSMTPMVRKHNITCFSKLATRYIYPNLGPFRSDKQHNQYIFPLYEYFTDNTFESTLSFNYFCMKDDLNEIAAAIKEGKQQVLCLNDSKMSEEERAELLRKLSVIHESFNSILQ